MSNDFTQVNRKLLAYLRSGRDITSEQARQRFGITNVSARIEDLRKAGFAIYSNKKRTASGRRISVYRLGTPSREQVAAGFLALRTNAVSSIEVSDNLSLV